MQIKVLLKVTVIRQSLLLQLFRNSVCYKIAAIEFSVALVDDCSNYLPLCLIISLVFPRIKVAFQNGFGGEAASKISC